MPPIMPSRRFGRAFLIVCAVLALSAAASVLARVFRPGVMLSAGDWLILGVHFVGAAATVGLSLAGGGFPWRAWRSGPLRRRRWDVLCLALLVLLQLRLRAVVETRLGFQGPAAEFVGLSLAMGVLVAMLAALSAPRHSARSVAT